MSKYAKLTFFLTALALSCSLLVSAPSVQARSTGNIQLEVIYRKSEPDPLRTGEYADVWVKIKNTGNTKAEDVSLEFVPEFPFSLDPDKEAVKELGDMNPGVEYHAHYKIRVDENAVPGENDLKFKTKSDIAEITKTLPVQVRSRESVLSVERVGVEGGKIPPSKTRNVTLKLKNRADTYLRNIDSSLGLRPVSSETAEMEEEAEMLGTEEYQTAEEIPLITVGETTEKRIGKIAPGETKEVTFPVRAESDATEEAYKVPVEMRYEDEMGNTWQKIEFTGITVGGEPVVETGIADIDGYPVSDTSTEVSLRLVNRGLSEAKFLQAELLPHESYQVVGEPDVYVGHMQPDDFDSPSFTVYMEPDHERVEIPVELNYRDSEGNEVTEEQTVSFRTYTSGEISSLRVEEGGNALYYIVIILVIIGAVYLYRRRKKSKEKLLEE
ncbi:MAG: COG1361 S-layer family protein [Candidatus Aenigmatarchaeota archaeon]